MTAPPLTTLGTEVLLVFGARIRVSRHGRPGIRVSAGYHDGSIMLEAVGFEPAHGGAANVALSAAVTACRNAGLIVQQAPPGTSKFPCRVVRRRPPEASS